MPTSQSARWLVLSAVVVTAFAYTSQAADPLNVVKLTMLLYAVVVLLAVGAVSAVRTRSVTVPREPLLGAVAAFLLAALLAAAASPDLGTAVLGQYQRNTGLLLFLSCAIALTAVLLVFDPARLELLVRALLGIGAGFAVYGLFQAADLDPVRWSNPFNPILLTLGNPNFASAYLGTLVPVAAYAALRRTWTTPWRIAAALLAVTLFGLAAYSGSAQGPLCALAGLSVVAVAWLLDAKPVLRRRGLIALGSAVSAGFLLVLSAILGKAPSDRIELLVSARPRQWYWEAGAKMFTDRPWRGVGLDSYGAFYRSFRPAQATRELGTAGFTDSAHSVPLSMFSWGGVLLGVAFLVLLGTVAAALVAGLRRHTGERRLLLGGLGGAWLAWVVQGLVSIDQVPITLLGWVLCGATVVAARSGPARSWVLPRPADAPGATRRSPGAPTGKVSSSKPAGKGGKQGKKAGPARPRHRRWTTGDRVAVSVIVAAAGAGIWAASLPLRADIAARQGDEAVQQQRALPALTAYRKAVDIAPWRAAYWSRLGQIYEIAQRPELAWEAYRDGAEHDPRVIDVLQPAARLAVQLGHTEDAARLYRRLYDVDPDNPGTLTPYVTFLIAQGEAERAVEILREAVETEHSGTAEMWKLLGDAEKAAGDAPAARAAYDRAIELNADYAEAKLARDALG